jgi:hypothetical protein
MTVTFAILDRQQWGLSNGLQYMLYVGDTVVFTAIDYGTPAQRNAPGYQNRRATFGGLLNGDIDIYLGHLRHRSLFPEIIDGRGIGAVSTTPTLNRNAFCNLPMGRSYSASILFPFIVI